MTHARRQPGSAFKPFVFLAALRRGAGRQTPAVTPAVTRRGPAPSRWRPRRSAWAPRNFEDRFDGLITVRQALERSSNVAAIRLAQAAGLGRVVRTARDVGFTSRMTPVPALALGSFEVTPLELAAAYATLANGGTPVPGSRDPGGRTGAARLAASWPAAGVPSSRPRRPICSRISCAAWWIAEPARRRGGSAWGAPRRARPGPRTTRGTHGSPATRRAWSRWSGSGSTTARRSGCRAPGPRCRSGPTSCGRQPPRGSRGVRRAADGDVRPRLREPRPGGVPAPDGARGPVRAAVAARASGELTLVPRAPGDR